MIIAMAIILVSDISSTFDMLMESLDSRLRPLAEHLNEYYIHEAKLGKTITRQPKYCPSSWNVYESCLMKLPRTTNPVEGFHNIINIVCWKWNLGIYIIKYKVKND